MTKYENALNSDYTLKTTMNNSIYNFIRLKSL